MSMMMAPKNVYFLVDGVLDEGLPFVADYLENMLKCPIMITDHNGCIHYPIKCSSISEIDEVLATIPANLAGRDFYYCTGDNSLYYRVRCNGDSAYVIAQKLPVEQISQALTVMMETKLAVKCYFCKIHKDRGRFEHELAEYLFNNSNASIRDIIKLSENRLELDRPYFVSLVEIEGEANADKIDIQLVGSYYCEYLKKEKFEVIPIFRSNCLMIIFPVSDRSEEVPCESRLINYKEIIENRFNISLAQGIGQVHPLIDLHKSFNEARIALTLPRLLGKKHFVQKFSELGIYFPVFSQDLQVIKKYCLDTLGRLIEHDDKTEGELLPTLRKLLDSGVNMKSTADSLFIHVNTLYYRVNKIEELLRIDFADMDTRVNLFIAIKVWDTMNANGLFNKN